MKFLALLLAIMLLTGCQVVSLSEQPTVNEMQPAVPTAPQPERDRPEPVSLISLGQISVSMTEYLPDAVGGPAMLLELKNETSNELVFRIDHAKTDGIMCDPYWSCTVAAGETVESEVWWSLELMQKSGITALRELVLDMTICGSEDETVVLFADEVTLTLESTADAAQPPVWEGFAPQTLAETEQFSVTAVGYSQDAYPVLTLQIQNQTESALLCTVTDVLVDGEAYDPGWAAVIMADAVLYTDVVWQNLSKASEITMTLTVYNHDDWSAATLFSETVTVTVP